ncbi:unnamed protein product [Sphenostylis stenocarpa]|uniref:Uncharacterized protein n=1 Tax=Sphenostylis stenocarpa TaxID=92480 RepID=A0AA86SJA3_9FABA|nr:unnamed protein product [Sphenostylis stenocarpa]
MLGFERPGEPSQLATLDIVCNVSYGVVMHTFESLVETADSSKKWQQSGVTIGSKSFILFIRYVGRIPEDVVLTSLHCGWLRDHSLESFSLPSLRFAGRCARHCYSVLSASCCPVTKREVKENWKSWKWRSSKDLFLNDAYFVPSGFRSCAPNYSPSQSLSAAPAYMVPAITLNAGPINCIVWRIC